LTVTATSNANLLVAVLVAAFLPSALGIATRCLPPFDAAQILQATPLRWAAVSFGRRAGAMSKEKKSAEKQEQPHHQQMPCVIAPWEN